jgi:phospholipid/cholesterol/gamma-HCH transport system permease protein
MLNEVGKACVFFAHLIRVLLKKGIRREDLFEQIWKVITQSYSTITMAGFFVGAVMTIQFALQLNEFSALGYLGGLATSGTVRELGPLLIAFMLSGKVGAFTAAELSTMRVTEQMDAIRCLGADPIREIILPRFFGIIFASLFLLIAGIFMSILGGMLMGYLFAGVNAEEYLRHIPSIVKWYSVLGGTVKVIFFSIGLGWIATYLGYNTSGGAKGVGKAVVNTAVATMVAIVFIDWLTTFLNETFLKVFEV